MYAREDVDLSRSTMASWAGQCSRLLEPLIAELKKDIFASAKLHSDDTPIKVLAPGTGKTKTGRIWTYVRDGRNYGCDTPPAVCYFYSPDRKGIRPLAHLKDFTGVLHADAYAGYDQVYELKIGEDPKILEAACWAHTRRKFYEVTVNSDNATQASHALDQISEIYQIEAEIKGQDANTRQQSRQARSKPIIDQLFIDWQKCYPLLPKKSATAMAINYALKNEIALCRYLSDGEIQIDNNAAERAIRSIALGRKNWLFAVSEGGAEANAILYSMSSTCRGSEISFYSYIKYILENHRVLTDKERLRELLPHNIDKKLLYKDSS